MSETEETEEMERCPFCGKKGTLFHSVTQNWYMPQCEDNHCVAGEDGADLINTKEEAIKIWNTRHDTH